MVSHTNCTRNSSSARTSASSSSSQRATVSHGLLHAAGAACCCCESSARAHQRSCEKLSPASRKPCVPATSLRHTDFVPSDRTEHGHKHQAARESEHSRSWSVLVVAEAEAEQDALEASSKRVVSGEQGVLSEHGVIRDRLMTPTFCPTHTTLYSQNYPDKTTQHIHPTNA